MLSQLNSRYEEGYASLLAKAGLTPPASATLASVFTELTTTRFNGEEDNMFTMRVELHRVARAIDAEMVKFQFYFDQFGYIAISVKTPCVTGRQVV